ncbi:cytochrome P450 [Sistotremastrum niveocremeum HHB9708]|uniref:Cytochrome P450 n=1 Tax=Sistotremastrum niveocremeum HHB9708 TaxID=1314777 RepID=A0A164R1G6_9AGAM|nr:cytochrome P450 [Sistotremastrum niveocremeum HHB9708]
MYLIPMLLLSFSMAIVICHVLWQFAKPHHPNLPPLIFHWIPVFGSALQYGTDPIQFFSKCREKHGNVFTFILFGRRMTVALGAKGNHFVTGGKLAEVSAEAAYTDLTTPVFGKDVVFDVPNHVLMEQKRFVKFGLSVENFRAYVGLIEKEVRDYLATDPSFSAYRSTKREEWGSFDVLKSLQELTIFTASRTLQGEEVRSSLNKSFAGLYNDLDGGFTPLNLLFPNLPLPSNRRRDQAQKAMSEFYIRILAERKSTNASHDMLSALATQSYKDGTPLTDQQIAHIMIALLMAGQHTSSATASWALLHLAHRPDVAQALFDEQTKYFSSPDGSLRPITYDELRELPLLDSIIRETLRLHPPIHSIMRKVVKNMTVPGSLTSPSRDINYVIPKGDFILSSPALSQIDPTIWKDSLTWDPYRWSDPEGVASQASKSYDDATGEKIDYGFGIISKGTESPYQPFGAGRHRCIGEQFAYLQLGVILVTMVRHLEMKLDGPFPSTNFHTLIPMPGSPRVISYKRRAPFVA